MRKSRKRPEEMSGVKEYLKEKGKWIGEQAKKKR